MKYLADAVLLSLLILNIFHAFLLVFLLVTLSKLMLAGKLDLKMFKPLCNISKNVVKTSGRGRRWLSQHFLRYCKEVSKGFESNFQRCAGFFYR